MKKRHFACFIYLVGPHCLSLGVHIDVTAPHIDIHFPFGLARIGWEVLGERAYWCRSFGYDPVRWYMEQEKYDVPTL